MIKNQYPSSDQSSHLPTIRPAQRSTVLFTNFFLIILAYYHIKPASRSLFIEYLGADQLPYVWIGTALCLGTVIGYYNRLVERQRRLTVVLGTCVTFIGFLLLFALLLRRQSAITAIAFYIFVDIFSVVLVEQFWSLTDTLYGTEEGKRWYGIVGTGGLVGGVLGSGVTTLMLRHTPMQTQDLLLVAAAILGLIVALNLIMGRWGVYREAPSSAGPLIATQGGWRTLLQSRYLVLIATILLLAQLAQPLVEYQFIKTMEITYQDLDLDIRTAFLSFFFAVMGLVSIAVNLTLTPLIHRYLGVIAGLVVQPLMLCLFSFAFMLQSTLFVASLMKISDRGLSYSINRASKELLYVPIDPVHIYQAKAWIDMFGYRMFKVFGSLLILALTQWSPINLGIVPIGWFTLSCCFVWMFAIVYLAHEYRMVTSRPVEA